MASLKKSSDSEKEYSGIRTVERAISILKAFTRAKPRLNLSELAQIAGLNKSSLLRFVRTLEKAGFVSRDPLTKYYQLGIELAELGILSMENNDVQRIARPFLEDLNRKFDETIHLGVLENGMVVYRDKIDPVNKGYRMASRIGKRIPIHCTALGKVFASFLQDGELSEIIEKIGINRYSPKTITSIDDLREHLALVRQRGFAIDEGEYNELVRCAAAPVFDHEGNPIAAIGISSIGIEINSKRFKEFIVSLQSTANQISMALGYFKNSEDGSA
jgi:IclR family transcriptional regulator, KDG regulon repressor